MMSLDDKINQMAETDFILYRQKDRMETMTGNERQNVENQKRLDRQTDSPMSYMW